MFPISSGAVSRSGWEDPVCAYKMCECWVYLCVSLCVCHLCSSALQELFPSITVCKGCTVCVCVSVFVFAPCSNILLLILSFLTIGRMMLPWKHGCSTARETAACDNHCLLTLMLMEGCKAHNTSYWKVIYVHLRCSMSNVPCHVRSGCFHQRNNSGPCQCTPPCSAMTLNCVRVFAVTPYRTTLWKECRTFRHPRPSQPWPNLNARCGEQQLLFRSFD